MCIEYKTINGDYIGENDSIYGISSSFLIDLFGWDFVKNYPEIIVENRNELISKI